MLKLFVRLIKFDRYDVNDRFWGPFNENYNYNDIHDVLIQG